MWYSNERLQGVCFSFIYCWFDIEHGMRAVVSLWVWCNCGPVQGREATHLEHYTARWRLLQVRSRELDHTVEFWLWRNFTFRGSFRTRCTLVGEQWQWPKDNYVSHLRRLKPIDIDLISHICEKINESTWKRGWDLFNVLPPDLKLNDKSNVGRFKFRNILVVW